MRAYRRLKDFKQAIDRGEIPSDTMLILDNDGVHAYTDMDDEYTCVFRSDPNTLLREALDLLDIEYDEA